MSTVWVTSDWHLGHKNVRVWREEGGGKLTTLPKIPQEEQEELILENYRSLVTKRDIVWFLGDIILGNGSKNLELIGQLPGDKRLILGNHDTDRFAKRSGMTVEKLLSVFSEVHGMKSYRYSWRTHAPLHPGELRGKINIHGHCHIHTINDPRYVNVCLEHTNYAPIKYQDIIDKLYDEGVLKRR